MILWDRGTWEPVGDPREGLAAGKLIFKLHGEKLAGLWELVRISKPGEKKQDQWLLLKKRGDAWTRPTAEYNVITALPDSVTKAPLGPVEEREPHDSQRAAALPLQPTTALTCRAPSRPRCLRSWRRSSPRWSLPHRPAATGFWRTSSTVTACSPASSTERCVSSRARATTGLPS